jgi:phosphate starvation-inducible PhoH-like protein
MKRKKERIYIMFLVKMFSHLFLTANIFTNAKKITTKLNTNTHKKSLTPSYIPKSINQQKYVDLLKDKEKSLIVALGPAGCGKTLFACSHAIESLKTGEIQKIVLTRPMVSVEDEEIGFLPGNIVSKMDPWTKPMFDIFSEYFSMNDLNGMIQSGTIEICPLAFMRGRTFHRSFVLADEMQNSSPTQILMLATRLGFNSKMVMMGDLQQSDRPNQINGLADFIDKYNKRVEHEINGMGVAELEKEDVMRSNIVKQVLDLYAKPEMSKIDNSFRMEMSVSVDNDAALISKKDEMKLSKRKIL